GREEGQAGPLEVEAGNSYLTEADRREHPLHLRLPEVRAAGIVDPDPREALEVPELFHVPVVHPVVAEPTEEELREGVAPVPVQRRSRRTPEPEGRMIDREQEAVGQAHVYLGE